MHSEVLFGLTLLLGHLCVCDGVKCYSCNYATKFSDTLNSNKNCDEGTNFNGQNLTTTECNGKCSKVRGSVGGNKVISRDCFSPCVPIGGAGQGTFCCATDYCNDTWQMEASLVAALASVLATFLLRA